MEQEIYLDHAATTRLSAPARAAMEDCLNRFWGNPSSLHGPGQAAKARLEEAREAVAAAVGAEPREIYFTAGGTEADNWALLTGAGGHVISSKMEHHAVLRPLERRENVTLLDVSEDGVLSPEALEKALRPDTALVSLMYVNNEVGTVQPIRALGEVCRRAGVIFHTDAVQAVGHVPVNVGRDCVDMLSLSGHKLGGPRGAGALYVRRGTPMERLLLGGAQERGWRAGTENLPAIAGLAAALEDAVSHMTERRAREERLRNRLIDGLSQIPDCRINGDPDCRCPGIVSACFSGVRSESLLLRLDRLGICASAGAACASGALEPSHVLLAMGLPEELAKGALRLSLSWENTEAEIDRAVQAVTSVVSELRSLDQE